MIIYNDYYEEDYLANMDKLVGRTMIASGFVPSKTLADLARLNVCTLYYCMKMYRPDGLDCTRQAIANGITKIAVDAENYTTADGNSLEYSKEYGEWTKITLESMGATKIILLPEGFGGDRYKNYDKFIKGLRPSKLLMERTYNQGEWWNILFFYLRNIWVYLIGASLYIGVWPEEGGNLEAAQKIVGDRVFWYSETKSLPS